MRKDAMILYAIAAIAACFALVNAFLLLLKRGKTAQTTGIILSIKMPNAEMEKARNSKWAKITYTVDGKNYCSKNRIQVPMASKAGDSVTVCYDIDHPEKLYSFSVPRIVVSLLIALSCVLAAYFKLV